MDLNLRNSLPPWKEKFLLTDEGEAWKWRPELDAAKAVYMQWQEVYSLVSLFADTLQEEEGAGEGFTKRLIYENLMVVAPKIMSAAGDTLYIIKMENASIIRFNCRQMMDQVGYAALSGAADPKYKTLIYESMDVFKQRFQEWVAFFKPDEIDDDWGLYK